LFFFSSRRRHTRSLRDWSSDGALPIYRRARAHGDFDGGAEQLRQLVDHRNISRIRDDNDERLTLPLERHEAVSKHQVRRDGAERSEERRVGKEGRCRWGAGREEKK